MHSYPGQAAGNYNDIDHFGHDLVSQESVAFWSFIFSFAPSGLIWKVPDDSLFPPVDSHFYIVGALQILGYEDLLQTCEVSKCNHHYSKGTRAEEMRSNLWPDKDHGEGL